MRILSFLITKTRLLLAIAATGLLLFSDAPFGHATNQTAEMWQNVEEQSLDQNVRRVIVPTTYRTVRLDQTVFTRALANAPMEFTRHPSQNPIIYLPMPDGTLARFRFEQSPVVEKGLADQFPELYMTYRAQGVDDPTATSRFDWLPNGFHAIIFSSAGTVLIDPYAYDNTTDYITYWKRDAANTARGFDCKFVNSELPSLHDGGNPVPLVTSGTTLRTYRLALAADHEYCAAVGGNTIAGSLAAQVLIMNRVNGVYERDVAIHMNIVATNSKIVYAGDNTAGGGAAGGCSGACTNANDPYTDNDGPTMLGQNQTTCNLAIGSANYDIGHVFSTGGGGVAQLGVPCGGSKAQGVTGLPSPLGDAFAIDYVAHEMGHQWGANHTFNGASGNCGGGNRSSAHSYEPGSGITIMAYAGICDGQDLAAHSIDTFHLDSLNAIVAYSQTSTGNTCAVQTATGNTPPTVTGPGNFNIPRNTPFSLTASATDPNGDSITYDWQEFDLGSGSGTTAIPNSDAGGAIPILRQYSPTSSGTRTFPSLNYILNNANVPPTNNGSCPTTACLTGELLPSISRAMTFAVVARDNRASGGGINSTTSTVTVNSAAGPFVVTSPNTAVTIPAGNFTVTWNVANTTAAPVSTANVNILLSTDGGNTFPTTLLAGTPNDGSQAVTIPATPTTTARIKVAGASNIFFDISDANFTITAAPTPTPAPTASPTPSPTPAPTPTPSPGPTAIPVTISLPIANVATSVTTFTQPVTTTNIDAADNLIGIQGDFTFDSTVVTFQSPPVAAAGLTASNWTVAGNVLPGPGPIRTLRISFFSNDGVTPLSGSGNLFMLNMTRVSSTPGASTPLTWLPSPNDFEFINTDIDIRIPSNTPAGSITIVSSSTPTPTPTINISGNVDYCSNPSLNPVPGVTMTLTGSASGTAATDGSGNYTFASLPSGGSYTVTPTKTQLIAGSAGINTVDILGIQRHFLAITPLPAGCRLAAADVNGDASINTVDVVATQRFFLGFSTGTANVGKYSFSPTNRSYAAISTDQTGQNFDSLVFGDVASGFVHRPTGTMQDTVGAAELPGTVAMVSLPEVAIDQSRNDVTRTVTTTYINANQKLVGFQGDFTFDERVITFTSNPVHQAGLTVGNWNVSGNVLAGSGPIRTLRVSAYSTDFTPLSGKGILFELNMSKNGSGPQTTPLLWATTPNQFLFIDADLNTQRPISAASGRVVTDTSSR